MNENTFLKVGNGNRASQPMGDPSMGMPPMGSDASSMSMSGGPSMGGGMPPMGDEPNAMGNTPTSDDPNAMGGAPTSGDPNAMGGGMGQGNEGFDMGIGMTPEEDPKKWLQGASTKLATELRKYQQSQPSPDLEMSKTAVNTVAAASKTNLDDSQKNELMTSYADTMRDDGDDSGNGDDFDMGNDNSDNGQSSDMGDDPNAMGGGMPPMGGAPAGGDPNAMGGGMPPMGGAQAGGDPNASAQQMMEARINRMVSEMLSDITKGNSKKKEPATKVKHKEQSKNGYSFAPYTVKAK